MIDGELTRLRNVIRFSNSTRIKDESVAEHSFFTAYYSLILANHLKTVENIQVDIATVLSRALVHDIDEAKSGDFVRHFKYEDPSLAEHISKVTRSSMRGAFNDVFDNKYLVDSNYKSTLELQEYWENSKASGVEGDIVAFADFLSVLSYIMNEIDCGNKKLIRQLDDMYEYANSFYNRGIFSKYEEPRTWLFQVIALLNSYIGKDRDYAIKS